MVAAVITPAGEILYAALSHLGEPEPSDMEPPGTPLGDAYAPQLVEPAAAPGLPVVGITADRRSVVEKLGPSALGAIRPFDHFDPLDPAGVQVAEWFTGATIARYELPWQDLGDSAQLKNFLEVELTIDRDTRAYLGLGCEVDSGAQAYRWRGLVHGRKRPLRIPVNLLGTRLRIRLVAVVFNSARFMVRNMRIGFAPAGKS